MIHKFRDLFVWQKSIAFVKEIYKITTKYPKSELFGLTSQIQRAAVSMPT
ncbi:MAG: four helix bundle protein, partial [Paludibacteraceae bacterium]|nr:four helix bundle protein [Paludibacteraceae bacterium]